MKDTFLMTVFDRETPVLISTIYWLTSCDLDDCEIIVVNDRSNKSYDFLPDLPNLIWHDMEDYECATLGDGFNNPAKAFNKGLELASGERVFIMSSDCIIPPRTVERARRFDPEEFIYTPRVLDMAYGVEYCGPTRVFPMPWFLGASRQKMIDCGGWDENYMDGVCYEDNDFVGRLALETGKIMCDWGSLVYHQSHNQIAYQITHEETKLLNEKNLRYTAEKWSGGVPFDTSRHAFDMNKKRHETDNVYLECVDSRSLYEKAKSMTKSPFVKVAT